MNPELKGLKRYSVDFEDRIFEFQEAAYPDRDAALIPARWRWMFVESARLHRCEPLVWLYFRKGELVAHHGAIPVSFELRGVTHQTAWFVETMVLEKVRGGPVGAALVAKSLEDVPFNLSLGQSPIMRELQYRLGWKKIGPLNTYVYAVEPSTVLASRASAVRLAGGLGLRLWNFVAGKRRSAESREALDAREIDGFDDAHAGLWERIRGDYGCAVSRDSDFLNWKFVAQPGQNFTRYEVRDADGVRGIVVVRSKVAEGVYHYPRLEICEILAGPGDRVAVFELLRIALEHAADRNISLVYLHVRHDELEKHITAFGFIRREATRWLLLATEPLDDSDRKFVENDANWLLTGSDSDIDRP